MKKLVTTNIITGVGYPPSKKGIEFLYASNAEMFKAIGQALGGAPDSGTEAYALFGCEKTDLGGGNYSFSEGWIYDAVTQEIYYFPAVASIAITTAAILNIDTTGGTQYPLAYNPVLFTNNTQNNVHKNDQLVVSDGALGSGMINHDDLIYVNKGWKLYTPTFTATDYAEVPVTAPTASGANFLYKIEKDVMFIQAQCTNITTAASTARIFMTLPNDPMLSGKTKFGHGICNYDKYGFQGTGLPSFASVSLSSGGAGSGLNLVKLDGSDYGTLITYQFYFTITISLR